MKIREIRRPNLIADPDVVIVDDVPEDATSKDVLSFVSEHMDTSSYFGSGVELYAGETTATVKFFKD